MTDEFGQALSVARTLEYVRPLEVVDAPRIAAHARRWCGRLGTTCGILLLVCLNLPIRFHPKDVNHWWWQTLGDGTEAFYLLYLLAAGLAGTFFGAFSRGRVRAKVFIAIAVSGFIVVMCLTLSSAFVFALSVIGAYAAAGLLGVSYIQSKGLTVPRASGMLKLFGTPLFVCSGIVGGFLCLTVFAMGGLPFFKFKMWVFGPALGGLAGYVAGLVAGIMALRAARSPLRPSRDQVIAILCVASVLLPLLSTLSLVVRFWITFGSASFLGELTLLIVRLNAIAISLLLFLSLGVYELLTEPCLTMAPQA